MYIDDVTAWILQILQAYDWLCEEKSSFSYSWKVFLQIGELWPQVFP